MLSKGALIPVTIFLLCLTLVTAPAVQAATVATHKPTEKGQKALDEGPAPAVPGVYYDFPDVLIPRELELVRDESFVYDTPTLSAGLLVFSGRVKVKSLSNFFQKSMTQDNWILGARFTSPKIVQLFEKPNRRALIIITETTFSTRVEVWVAPYLGLEK